MIDWDLLEGVETESDLELKAEVEAAKVYLKDTDWYAIRFMEVKTPIPQDVSMARAAARAKISEASN